MGEFKSLNGHLVKDETARNLANNNKSNINALLGDVSNLKDTTQSHESSINTIQNNMSTINQNIAKVNEDIDTANSYMNSVNANVNAMQNTFNGVTGDITNLKNDNTTNKNKITTLESDNTTNKADILELESKVETLETSQETNNASLKQDPSICIPITPLSGGNHEAYGNSFYYKIGTKVYVHIGLNNISTTGVTIFHMPEGYRPKCYSRFMVAGSNYENNGQIVINSDGTMVAAAPSTFLNGEIEYEAFY